MARKKAQREIEEIALDADTPRPAWLDHDWTVQEVSFVSEYLRTGNATASYRRACLDVDREYTPMQKMAHRVRAQEWLNRKHIRSYVDEIRAEIKARLTLSAESVLEELNLLARSNMADFVVVQEDGTAVTDLSGLTREQMAAIQEMTIDTYVDGKGESAREVKSVKLKLAPKLGALEALGKHFKRFTDVIEDRGNADLAEEMRQAREDRARRKAEREHDSGADADRDADDTAGNDAADDEGGS